MFELLVYLLMISAFVWIIIDALSNFVDILGNVLAIRAGRWEFERAKNDKPDSDQYA